MVAKFFYLPFNKGRSELKMKSFTTATIRLLISFGKFGIMFYTLSLVNISLNSSDSLRYLKTGSPILKLSAAYIQDRTNSNIRRTINNILKNKSEDLV
jgi:hypothetical protein